MKRNMVGVLAVAISALLLAGCGGSTSKPVAIKCEQVSDGEDLGALISILKPTATIEPSVFMVRLPNNAVTKSWPRTIVAAKVNSGGTSTVAIWAMGYPGYPFPIQGLNTQARELSVWWTTPIKKDELAYLDQVATLDAASQVEACVRNQKSD
jgi:hypothetical protein